MLYRKFRVHGSKDLIEWRSKFSPLFVPGFEFYFFFALTREPCVFLGPPGLHHHPAKVPISRSCKWSHILLKDCKGNIDLFRLAISSFTTTSCSLSVHGDSTNFLKDLSNEQPRGPYKPISHPTPRRKIFNLNTYHRLQSKHEVYLTEIPL
jgi:hypothetical protein